jgi:hypothetical protein
VRGLFGPEWLGLREVDELRAAHVGREQALQGRAERHGASVAREAHLRFG